jgi:hypothetical protein
MILHLPLLEDTNTLPTFYFLLVTTAPYACNGSGATPSAPLLRSALCFSSPFLNVLLIAM